MAGGRRASAMPIAVRDMHHDDLTQVASIEAASFSDAWAPNAFAELLDRTYARLRVATSADGTVVGYCILLRAADEGEIANICASPVVRGQGIGGVLLDDALEAADVSGTAAVYLEVRTSNVVARALYEGRGFSLVGRRKGYYQHPTEDALVLRRTRSSSP